jgi:hypothetical protein
MEHYFYRSTLAFGDWIIQEMAQGRLPYYLNIMFHPLKGASKQTIINQMQNAIYETFYPTLCNRVSKHPRRKCQEQLLPRAILVCDLPVWKHDKTSLGEISLNQGLHYNGIISMSPRCCLDAALDEHIREQQHLYVDHIWHGHLLYDRGGISRVHAKPITFDFHNVAGYSFKTVRAGKVDYDTTIILPRTRDEMRSTVPELDVRARAIKDLLSSRNVSEEVAERLYLAANQHGTHQTR